jgi:DNA-binding NtrC family response regulator
LKAEEEFERGIILDALKKANYVQSHAAEMLGISRRILKYKMDKLGISQDNTKDY